MDAQAGRLQGGAAVNLPTWWEFGLAALAVYRLFHLIAEDTILDKPRYWVLRLGWNWMEGQDIPKEYREEWGIFLQCKWCLGFWLSGLATGVYCMFVDWIGVLSLIVVWFALSASVALIATVQEAITED